jgi:hypothetical protein
MTNRSRAIKKKIDSRSTHTRLMAAKKKNIRGMKTWRRVIRIFHKSRPGVSGEQIQRAKEN